jgi:hypothetical protein
MVRRRPLLHTVAWEGTSPTTPVLHRLCRVVAGRSRSKPVRSAAKCLLQPVILGQSRSCRSSPYRPVTPEVAGSSPVAPVFEAPTSRPVLRTLERPSRPCDRPRRELVVMTSRTAVGQRAGPPWRDSLTSPLDVACTSASRSPDPVCTSARGRRGSAGKPSARRSSDLREPRAARYDGIDAGGARIGQLDRTTRRERGATP